MSLSSMPAAFSAAIAPARRSEFASIAAFAVSASVVTPSMIVAMSGATLIRPSPVTEIIGGAVSAISGWPSMTSVAISPRMRM